MTASQDTTSYFNEVYDTTNRAVLGLITAKCGKTEDIGDIFQETYMTFFRSLERKGTAYPKDASRLVIKIAKRKIAEHYARKARQPAMITSVPAGDGLEEISPWELEADPFLVEEFVIDAAMMEEAKQYLLRKSPDIRKIFYLFYHLDFSIPKIAKQMSLSESNVKNKLYRTVNELKAIFHEERMG